MATDKPITQEKQDAAGIQVEPIVMCCRDCCHWEQSTKWDHDGAINYGCCSEHMGLKVQFELISGWNGGVVDKVETEEDFFCANYNTDCHT